MISRMKRIEIKNKMTFISNVVSHSHMGFSQIIQGTADGLSDCLIYFKQ